MTLESTFKVHETIPYDLRVCNKLHARNPITVRYGTETISFLSPKIWSLIPQNIKDSGSLPCLKKKKKNRKWKPNCPCRLCKHICNMLVLFSSTAVLPSQFFSFFGFVWSSCYLFIFILHIVCKNYSYIIYLGICFNFQNL